MSNQEETIAALNRICEKLGDIHSILSEHMEYTRYRRPSAEERERKEKAIMNWLKRNEADYDKLAEAYRQSDEYREAIAAFPERPEERS